MSLAWGRRSRSLRRRRRRTPDRADKSAHDLDVELRAAELTIDPHPQRKKHLQPTGGVRSPRSNTSVQPRSAASDAAVCRAVASLPATKTVESSPSPRGLTITSFAMVLNIFTSRASGSSRCSCSASESVLLTKSEGGNPWEKSSAFEVSMTTLLLSASPTALSAGRAPRPFVALMNRSASRSWYAASGRSR